MRTLALAWTCLLLAIPCSADIIYVKAGGTGSGTSWSDAYGYLQDGLDDADPCDVIWVAAGTYYPTSDYGLGIGDRGKHFRMKNGVAIYGGFPDIGDPDIDDRDPNQYETILSGDIGTQDDPNDNCYHVFYHPNGTNLDSTAILDGFTITSGWANAPGDEYHYSGGGMYNEFSNPIIANCNFTGNSAYQGGGMYNKGSGSSPAVTNCTFTGNWADYDGGGMYNLYSNPTVTGCIFTGNSARYDAGGMYNRTNSPTVTGCTFSGNSANWDGGGMFNWHSSSPTVTNCTFTDNSADHGGGIYNYTFSNPTVTNCKFIGNSARYGGGMDNYKSSPIVTNCSFTSNAANSSGGGMFNWNYSSSTATNCTFTDNSADEDGGGMFNGYYSSPTITNCILWGNTAALGGNEIALKSSSTIDVDFCDVQGGLAGIFDDLSGNTINWGSGNIDVDPLFIDADGADNTPGTEDDNLRLQAGSPCIDTGDNSVVDANSTDLDGNPRIVNGTVDIGAYEFFHANTAPVADAGLDQTVFALADGMAEVKLDGSGSFDPDGDELDYFWFIGDEQIATGVDPNVQLSVGEHIIELIVNDGSEDSEPNEVLITVIEPMPIEADVHIVPRVINRNNRMKRVMAIIRLPGGIGKGDVVGESFELYAGGLDGEPVGSILERVIGWGNMTKVFVLFDKKEVMNAVEGVGMVELTVVGRLESGQYIQGSDIVRIIRRGRGPKEQTGLRRKGTRSRRNRVQNW